MADATNAWPGNWFVGESELDPGEWGFDGTVWAAPTADEVAADARGEWEAEPSLVAEHVRDPRDAALIAAAPKMLAALKLAREWTDYMPLETVRRIVGAIDEAEGRGGNNG